LQYKENYMPLHRLIAVDLDGTLLTNDKKVTDRTKETIRRFTAQGCMLVPVTGRPLFGIPDDVIELAGNSYAVTMNGAEVFSLPDKKCIFASHIQPQTVLELLDVVEPFAKAGIELFCGGYGYVTEKYYREVLGEFRNSPLYKYYAQSRKHVQSIRTFAQERNDIAELAGFCTDIVEMDMLCQAVRKSSGIKVIRTAREYVEIISENTDKGSALACTADSAGFARSEVIAFGDGANDIAMLEYAETSVAMANAANAVKSAAKCGTCTNEEDGVAEWLIANM
jgi:Cof subfamily protein (haloacid dehalogenase superfamily)